MSYETYEHHGHRVRVRSDLKGKHREHCLCYSCKLFVPEDRVGNCHVANIIYGNCIQHNVVTPVWECPRFKEREAE